jgi:pimeloyl-ACP methyl ester carboxylesterase
MRTSGPFRLLFAVFPLLAVATACEPEAPGPMSGHVTAEDGVPIVFDAYGEGETAVVFLHCWACNRSFWREQIEPVAAAGYRVVAIDFPGHGDSGAERARWSIGGLGGDVRMVADDLGLERMLLVGHSMGGPVALEAARRLPGRVTGVICVDTLHDVEFEWPEGMTEQMVGRLEADLRAGMEGFVPQLFRDDADPALVRWVIDEGVASDQRAIVSLMRAFEEWDPREALGEAGVPVRCINAAPEGEQGLATAVERNRAYGDFDAVIIEGVGHYPQLESPEAFNAELLRLLRALDDGTSE